MFNLCRQKRRDQLHHEATSQEPITTTVVQETPHAADEASSQTSDEATPEATPEATRIDEPLGLSDVPSDDDHFDIGSYIKGLTEFIEGCSTPMTISIQGDWGTGKTSIMRQVMKRLEDDNNKKAAATNAGTTSDKACEGPYRTIWFNTWQFSQTDMDDDLAVALLMSLVDEVCTGKEARELSSLVYSVIGLAKKAVLLASVYATNKHGDTFSEMVRSLLDRLLNPHDDNSYVQSVKKLKDRLQHAIDESLHIPKKPEDAQQEYKDRFVIFIDDLDRLKPERTIELLEVLKNFLDCRHCVFVIAADYHAIVAGAKAKYGDGFSDEKGRNFFDKIIQLEFRVPTDFYVEEKFIKHSLERLGVLRDDISDESKSKLVETFKRLIKASVTTNPRSMIRLFNSYKLMSLVMKDLKESPEDSNNKGRIAYEAVNDDVKDELLFATMCMQTRFRKFYKLLVRYADDNGDDRESEERDLASLKKLIQNGTFVDREADDRNDGAAETGVSREFLTELQDLLGMELEEKTAGESNGGKKSEEVTFKDMKTLDAFRYVLRHSITTSAEDLSLTPEKRAQEMNYRILSEAKRRLAEESTDIPAIFGDAEVMRTDLGRTQDRGGVYFKYAVPDGNDVEYLFGLTKTVEDYTLLRFVIIRKGDDEKSFFETVENSRDDEGAVTDEVVKRMKRLLRECTPKSSTT